VCVCVCVCVYTDLMLTDACLDSHPQWLPSGHLGTWREFNQNVVLPITKGSQPDSSNDEIATRARKQEALNEAMAPISLRRTKELLKDQLPTKRDMVVFCLPTVMQRECYNNMLDSDDAQVLLQRDDPCDHKPPWVLARRHKYEPNAATLGLLVVKLTRILCSDVLRRMSVGATRPCACVRTLYSRHPSVRC
jgi:SNF2 family DNA or RNA helicase